MYGRNNEIDFVKTNIDNNNLIYADKKRSLDWERSSQVQFLTQRFSNPNFEYSILTKERLVNFIFSQNQETLDKKISLEWERECKVQFLAQVLPTEGSINNILSKDSLVKFLDSKKMVNGTSLYFEEVLEGNKNKKLRGKTLFKKENDISNARLLNIISMNNESTNIEKAKIKVHDGVAISPFMSTKVDAAAISAEREPNSSLSVFIDKSIAQYAKNKKNSEFYIKNNKTYGFAYNGKIYLDPELMNSEVAVHEYTHLWDNYTMKTNPELWEKGKEVFKRTSLWNEVKDHQHYKQIFGTVAQINAVVSNIDKQQKVKEEKSYSSRHKDLLDAVKRGTLPAFNMREGMPDKEGGSDYGAFLLNEVLQVKTLAVPLKRLKAVDFSVEYDII